jgi:hypothetical protein
MSSTTNREIEKSVIFFVGVVGWTAIWLLPVQLNPTSEGWKVMHVLLSALPLVLSTAYLLYGFAYVVYNKKASDDSKINIIALMFAILSWIVAWSDIYLNYWIWFSTSAFPKFPHVSNLYEAWVYMLGISGGIYASDQPVIADADMASLAFLVGIHSITSIFINVFLLAVCGALVYDRIKQKTTKENISSNISLTSDYGNYYVDEMDVKTH